MDLCKLTALELGALLGSGEITPEDALRAARPDELNAFITKAPSPAPPCGHSSLAGVPMAYKDNICIRGFSATCASGLLEDFVPSYNATVAERLRASGAVSLGKLNMDEFAMGGTGESSYFGPTRNPWDTGRSPGGSSSGSGAAVAAGQVWYTLGSDTGGSVRQPAAYCGITGFKPTYGALSRYGLIAHASSLDQIGPIARSAEDCAAVLSLLAGRDPRDAVSLDLPPRPPLSGDLRGIKIGIIGECFAPGLSGEIARAVEEAAAALRARGAVTERCSLPALRYAPDTYVVLSTAEASSNLSRFHAPRYGLHSERLGSEVRRRILLGTYFLCEEDGRDCYARARKAQDLLRAGFDALFDRYDLLLTPTTAATAPLLGSSGEEDVSRLCDSYTVSPNLAGLPALSMPCGFDGLGLPMGAQLIGPRLGDWTVLNAAHGYQLETCWHRAVPWEQARKEAEP